MYRRHFLAALAAGTGAVLMGKGWYRQGPLYVPPPIPNGTMVIDRASGVLYVRFMGQLTPVKLS